MIRSEDFQHEWSALDALVDAFAVKMKAKLRSKLKAGYSNWDEPNFRNSLHDGLHNHLDDEPVDYVDVGNFAAFLWNLTNEE